MFFFLCASMVQLCHRRGLDVSGLSQEELKNWLNEWVELSSAASGKFKQTMVPGGVLWGDDRQKVGKKYTTFARHY